MTEPVPLAELERDLTTPADGWTVELGRRGVALIEDDLGRPAISRTDARTLFSEHAAVEARRAAHRERVEREAIEADRQFRAQVWGGIPAGEIPEGLTPGQLLMASDPLGQGPRRTSVLEHALEHPAGELIYRPVGGES